MQETLEGSFIYPQDLPFEPVGLIGVWLSKSNEYHYTVSLAPPSCQNS